MTLQGDLWMLFCLGLLVPSWGGCSSDEDPEDCVETASGECRSDSTPDDDGSAGGQGSNGPPESVASIAGGPFVPLSGYEELDASGFALLIRAGMGATASLQVNGLAPNVSYVAHLHALPCDVNAAGGHYKIDPTIEAVEESNELWLRFESDDNGAGLAVVESEHKPREDGMSVVIHDSQADGAKMLCADLLFTADIAGGSAIGDIAPFAAAEALDEDIAGGAMMRRVRTGTNVSLLLSGLSPDEAYIAYVHGLPCDVDSAGGHYKIDPTIEAMDEDNELWVPVDPDEEGMSETVSSSAHTARPDAQAIVIYRMTEDGARKVACADLLRDHDALFVTRGAETILQGARDSDLSDMTGMATMVRQPNGQTLVLLMSSRLVPLTEYMAYVDERPCSVADGGGHYRHDLKETGTVESNEVWLRMMTGPTGLGVTEALVDRLLRADAQSIVLHGDEGVRLACFDLQRGPRLSL